jgi:hypothetical protein
MEATRILAWGGVVASCHLVILIWVVQWRVYPSFRDVSPARWEAVHQRHTRRFAWLAGIPMVVELAGSLALAIQVGNDHGKLLWAGGLLFLTLATWGLTFARAVPLHRALEAGHSRLLIDALVRANRGRTALWTFKVLGLLAGLVWWDPL